MVTISCTEMLKTFAGTPRPPDDPFFSDGDKLITPLKKYGIRETDNEDYLHEPVLRFCCNVMGCKRSFNTIFQFEQHYNTYHRYSCVECKKNLATPHLLDLHISELHDAFFAVQAEKKPMYACFAEDCKEIFASALLRKDHCFNEHNFPASFWCDQQLTEKKRVPKLVKKQQKMGEKCINGSGDKKGEMEIDGIVKVASSDCAGVLGAASGRGANKRKQKIFVNFTKDLTDSLPSVSGQ